MQALTGKPQILDKYSLSFGPAVPCQQALTWLDQLRQWPLHRVLPGAEPLSAGDVFRLDSALGPVVVKRRFECGVKGALARSHLREPQLLRSFRLGQRALAAGLHTPEPLLYAERKLGLGLETFIINRFDAGVQPWTLLTQEWLAPRMLDSLGRELANWHAAGLRHRDLKGPNLLYQATTGTSILLDLAGVHECGVGTGLSQRIRAQDLARLRSGALSAGIAAEQWQRLLAGYLRQSSLRGSAIVDRRDFLGSIDRFVQRKLQRSRRNNKPVY
jgi:tRNA A-37 threonylcarbamoyl transferase component Bud32